MSYTVKEVAELAGVSVRTLHYYDQIGLLKPRSTTDAGYRLYGGDELRVLQQILFYRELGFPLSDIKTIVGSPDFDRLAALQRHRVALVERRKRIGVLVRTIDRTIAELQGETAMAERQLFEGFDVDRILAEHETYSAEVDATYDPTLVAESRARASRYSKEEWGRIFKEGGAITEALGALKRQGVEPRDHRVQELIAKHHRYIDERFYSCSLDVYRGLGELYVNDARFAANFDKVAPGLAQFVSSAIRRYCDDRAK